MKRTFIVASLTALAFFASSVAYAAQITAAASAAIVAPNAPFTITVSMTTDQNPVNVVQGSIDIPSGVVVEHASTAGSAFTLWPTLPAYSATDKQVDFSGGVPDGVAKGTTVELFTIQAHATAPGTYSFTPDSIQAFQNDGKGTPEAVTVTPASITVAVGASSSAVAPTGTAQPLVATVGRESSLHSGDYFITMSGGDRGDGILSYEVQEGNGAFVSTGPTYVIKDQSLSEDITVRALDANGISAQTVIKAQHHSVVSLVWVVIGLLIAGVLIYLIFFRKKKP